MKWKIPLYKVLNDSQEVKAVSKVIKRGMDWAIGPEIEKHNLFPEKCNVTIAQVINKSLIKVKVWERGAGLTKACGTAACATEVAGKINGLTGSKTEIAFPLGNLSILIDNKNSIYMTGPVSEIEEIEVKL